MGWGEPHGPSARMVLELTVRRAADAMADAIDRYNERPTTRNGFALAAASYAYHRAKDALGHDPSVA